jgi:hypothetical protein
MKTLAGMLIMLALFVSVASADFYIKEESHTDGYYYGGRTNPPVDRVTETWIGDNQAAFISEHRSVIFDLNKNTLTYINLDDSTFVVTALPMEWDSLADAQTAPRVQMFSMAGTVKETDKTKTIDKRLCKCFEISTWIPYQGTKYNEQDSQVWITTDVPFDIEMFDRINQHRRKLFNFGEELLADTAKLPGLALVTESEVILKASSYKSSEKVVEMKKADPPKGVYAPPAGFTQKDRVSMADLQGDG